MKTGAYKCTKCGNETDCVRTEHVKRVNGKPVNLIPTGEKWCRDCSTHLGNLTSIHNNRVEAEVNELYERLFTKYYHPKALPDWSYHVVNSRVMSGKDKIRELLLEGKKVKTGYMATSIREVHDFIIFYK